MDRIAFVFTGLILAATLGLASYTAFAGGMPQDAASSMPDASTMGESTAQAPTTSTLPSPPPTGGASASGGSDASAEFASFDMNADGSLSMDEVSNDPKMKASFRDLDKDQSNTLSMEEWSSSSPGATTGSGSADMPLN